MEQYRLYMLSIPSRKFIGAEDFEASDDGAAIAIGHAHPSPLEMELWSGARKVADIPERNHLGRRV